MASGTGIKGGLGDALSKVRMPKKTKQAVQMGESFGPTQAGIQYWNEVKKELQTRKLAYDKALTKFKEQGGVGGVDADENTLTVELPGTSAKIFLDKDNKVGRVQLDIAADRTDQLIDLANAITAVFGLAKSEEALAMTEELHKYLENDGFLTGLNGMANNTILQNAVLTALAMIPEDAKEQTEA